MTRYADRGRYHATLDLEHEFGCEEPQLDELVNRLEELRFTTGNFARFARGYLAFFVDEGLLGRQDADWVLLALAQPHWFVDHLPNSYLHSAA